MSRGRPGRPRLRRRRRRLHQGGVALGATVGKGDVIGQVGGSGTPETPGGFGSHPHYEQRTAYNGSSVQITFDNGNVHYYGIRAYTSSC